MLKKMIKTCKKAHNTTIDAIFANGNTAYQRGTKARADLVYQGVVMVTPT